VREAVRQTALDLRGSRYRFGGADPSGGFDCSGFVRYVLQQHGIPAPRTAAEQFVAGERVGASDVQPGDLVFFTTIAPGPSHVAIAIGGGEFVHAPSDGSVVRVDRLESAYWRDRYLGARRVIN
jgi:cell wall-associated NlpC family hydrolase